MENEKLKKAIPDICPAGYDNCMKERCPCWLILDDFQGCFVAVGMRSFEDLISAIKKTHLEEVRHIGRLMDALLQKDIQKIIDEAAELSLLVVKKSLISGK